MHSLGRVSIPTAAENDSDVDLIDEITTFLNGELEEEVLPELFDMKTEMRKMCLLKEAIYGFDQASKSWNKKLHFTLLKLGMKQTNQDPRFHYTIVIGRMIS
ncbi:hypothetical protein JTB14_007273 [Gonioctena quinquepunctata]|nr:hypothetical protein JTB14_007273 [Gonioctena quinquepunctata]